MLSEDTTFNVPDADTAAAYQKADPEFTRTYASEDGYTVLRKKALRLSPKLDPIDRNIAVNYPRVTTQPTLVSMHKAYLESSGSHLQPIVHG